MDYKDQDNGFWHLQVKIWAEASDVFAKWAQATAGRSGILPLIVLQMVLPIFEDLCWSTFAWNKLNENLLSF